MNLFDLTGKVGLITGGNSGLGLGYATGLAKAGADVIIWGRNAEKNSAAAEGLRAHGGRVHTLEADVTDEAQVVEAFAASVEVFGRIDAVFANAGRSTPSEPFVGLTTEKFDLVMRPNLYGVFWTTREAARHMTQRADAGDPGGSIVITGSLSTLAGMAGMENYATSKHAVAGLMKCLAVELGVKGVRVNALAPGLIQTAQLSDPDPVKLQRINAMAERTPIPRLGRPEDFEGVAVYLTSDLSAYHSGDVIVIDGGWMAKVV